MSMMEIDNFNFMYKSERRHQRKSRPLENAHFDAVFTEIPSLNKKTSTLIRCGLPNTSNAALLHCDHEIFLCPTHSDKTPYWREFL